MKTIIKAKEINLDNSSLVGNKAANLAELSKNGLETADFFVVSNYAFKRFLDKKALTLDLQKDIWHHLINFQGTTMAVRSSANVEDSKDCSFAGQFHSYLSVPNREVYQAVEDCFNSVFSDQVNLYCQYQKIDPADIRMAVIVQKMIKADKAGVIFTKDVFNDDKDKVIIEVVKGIAEKLVDGSTNSEKFIFSKKRKKFQNYKKGKNQLDSILTLEEAERLAEMSLQVEDLFGGVQDIEWAMEDDQIYILQTRPIT
ncbi:MAG: PEP/pyruvate-binding domain-containing protein [Candidatus Woesebacteria bacterium]|jgi:pyruvate,water dikinase